MDLLLPFASLPGLGLHLLSCLLQSKPGMEMKEKVSELNSSIDLKLLSIRTVLVTSEKIKNIVVLLIRFFALCIIKSRLGVYCMTNISTKL